MQDKVDNIEYAKLKSSKFDKEWNRKYQSEEQNIKENKENKEISMKSLD